MKKRYLLCIFLTFFSSLIYAEEAVKMSFAKRAELTSNSLASRLFTLMETKKTNLALAVDVTKKEELLSLADKVGPEICLLKTHIDILEDFDWTVIEELRKLAEYHQFILCEDRKFADIGNTVLNQYRGGLYKIVEWADLVTVHAIPGPGIIAGLKRAIEGRDRGILLIAEMSSKGNLVDDSYSHGVLQMAHEYSDFVVGLITQNKFSEDPGIIHMTPGVKVQEGKTKDRLGQQYKTPEKVITNGSDIIIVGRGITQADDPVAMAARYRLEAWNAYKNRLSNPIK